jgi:plasmid stability protein
MPVTLSIKNVPDDLAARLRARAATHHRSLQGELLAILEEAAQPKLTVDELVQRVKALGLRTPSDSVKIIRAHRDGGRR